MAIQDTQKLDYVWKKIGFAATKTDTNANKLAANEAIPSPLLLRGDKVWQQAGDIPATKPSSSSGVVTVYTGATTVETTEDNTATANRTWKTGQTDWIPPEFGSTYLVNVYLHDSGDAANAESISNKLFITGSGNDDEWFFDYQSGVLHFIGDNLPGGSFSGKSIYVAGAQYSGAFGVGSAGGEDANIGNLTVSNVTVSTATSGDPLILAPQNNAIVTIDINSGLVLPVGNTGQRPGSPDNGTIRFNSTSSKVEVYNGTSWETVGDTTAVTSDEFDGDGSTTEFTLSDTATTDTVFVVVNGTVQEAGAAYTVSGTTLTFTEAPGSNDRIQARTFFTAQSVNLTSSVIQDADNDTKIQVEESADEDVIRFDVAGSEVANIDAGGLNVVGNIDTGNVNATTFVGNLTGTASSYTVTSGDVTAHQANLSITESQISDFGTYLTSVSGNITVDSITTDEVYEVLTSKTSATGTVTHDLSTGHIFYHTSISADFTANFTNIDTTANLATTATLVLVQGSTAYIPTAVQISGSGQTINWQGGSQPTGTNNGIDIVTFSILDVGGSYTVLGQLTDF